MTFLVGTDGPGTLAILRQNPNKITVLYGCGFKNLGLGQTSAPLIGTKSQLLRNFFEGSPYDITRLKHRKGANLP